MTNNFIIDTTEFVSDRLFIIYKFGSLMSVYNKNDCAIDKVIEEDGSYSLIICRFVNNKWISEEKINQGDRITAAFHNSLYSNSGNGKYDIFTWDWDNEIWEFKYSNDVQTLEISMFSILAARITNIDAHKCSEKSS